MSNHLLLSTYFKSIQLQIKFYSTLSENITYIIKVSTGNKEMIVDIANARECPSDSFHVLSSSKSESGRKNKLFRSKERRRNRESNCEATDNLPYEPAEGSSSHLTVAAKKISRSLARYEETREKGRRNTRPVRARREHREVDEGTGHSREKRNRAGCRGVAMWAYQSGSSGFWLALGRREA